MRMLSLRSSSRHLHTHSGLMKLNTPPRSRQRSPNVVRTLLLHDAHADTPDTHGIPPEMVASENGRDGTAEVLKEW
jgi:hypothetical protein